MFLPGFCAGRSPLGAAGGVTKLNKNCVIIQLMLVVKSPELAEPRSVGAGLRSPVAAAGSRPGPDPAGTHLTGAAGARAGRVTFIRPRQDGA